SQYTILIRLALRPRNTNRWPENGSWRNTGLYQHREPVDALAHVGVTQGQVDLQPARKQRHGARSSSLRRRIGRGARIGDPHRDELRCRLELLLPTEQHTRRYPVATRHLGKARTRLPDLLN